MSNLEQIDISLYDYLILLMITIISVVIGIYFGIIRKWQGNPVEEYMFGSRQLPMIPVLLSNLASVISSVATIAIPRESYYHGAQIMFVPVSDLVLGLIMYFFILPVFYPLKLNSVFEYLERRYNKFTRHLGCIIYVLNETFLLLIVTYVTGKAITSVLPIPFHVFTPIACLLCATYTAVGGLRGVVWLDALQTVIIIITFLVLIIFGIIESGGLINVINIYKNGGRFNIDVFDFDPMLKYTPVYTFFTDFFLAMTTTGLDQGIMQRYWSLPSFKVAKHVAILTGIGKSLLLFIPVIFGMIIYAHYHDCDPGLSKKLKDTNQLVLYYIVDQSRQLPGLTGLFFAGTFAAGFSTMSTIFNSISIIIYEDFIKNIIKKEITIRTTNIILKCTVGIIGLIISFAVFALNDAGSLFQLFRLMMSLLNSWTVFVFSFGLIYRKANSKGAIIGGISGLVVTTWLGTGIQTSINSGKIRYNTKIVSIEGCPNNFYSNITTVGYLGKVPVEFDPDLPNPYRISFQLLTFIGVLVSTIIGTSISFCTYKENHFVDNKLLIPQKRVYSDAAHAGINLQEMEQLNSPKEM